MPEAGEERAPGGTPAEQAPAVTEEQGPAVQAPAVAEQPSAAVDQDPAQASPRVHDQDAAEPRSRWVFYGLGLSLQTLLWFLLFLAITIAVLVGNKLTEFRYVGF
jgi:hypothetical protein